MCAARAAVAQLRLSAAAVLTSRQPYLHLRVSRQSGAHGVCVGGLLGCLPLSSVQPGANVHMLSPQPLRSTGMCVQARLASSGPSVVTSSAADQAQDSAEPRRGFGAKVTLPAADVLHEVLVDQQATVLLRAYHIGAHT